jgi:Flp pilus assembly protein TadG
MGAFLNRRSWCAERGAELIEFALIFPLLLVVIGGIVDFGFIFQRMEVVTNAAREGARIAVLPGYNLADVQGRVQGYINEGLGPGAATATTSLNVVTITPASGAPFSAAQVTVNYNSTYLVLGTLIALVGGDPGDFGTITLTAQSTMRVEVQ